MRKRLPRTPARRVGLRPGAADNHASGSGRLAVRRAATDRPHLRAATQRCCACSAQLPADALDPALSGGDLCVQACANDPQVAFHAIRDLARIGIGGAVLRWAQLGFGRTSSTTSAQETPRNLQGFGDGTKNLHGDNADDDEPGTSGSATRSRRPGSATAATSMPGGSGCCIEDAGIAAVLRRPGGGRLAASRSRAPRSTGYAGARSARARRSAADGAADHPGERARPARRPRPPTAERRSCGRGYSVHGRHRRDAQESSTPASSSSPTSATRIASSPRSRRGLAHTTP